ncbi:MAG: hypothetical protein OIN87_08370 [Candidatus Methanoperedens sp.]|nr:hypothetical protein [Candidatus Methanoperedens sp.]
MAKEMYAVVHLFQGIVHEIKIFPEWDKAREAADKKIVEEYGELVEEQNGDNEIILEQAELVADRHDSGVLLDKASIRNALIDRMERGGVAVKRSPDFDKQTEDYYLHIEDALTGFLDDQYNMIVEDQEDEAKKEE